MQVAAIFSNSWRYDMATSSVRLDESLVEKASIMGKALNRTTPKQIEHWAKIGKIMKDNPDLPYDLVRQAIISQAEKDAGKLVPYTFG
jgi:hypothetical protein